MSPSAPSVPTPLGRRAESTGSHPAPGYAEMPGTSEQPMDAATVADLAGRIAGAVQHVVVGKPEAVRLALVAMLAEGHLLVEDVPGVGKTSLAKALARAVDGAVSRIQFTPDLLPGDITGSSIYDRNTSEFEFRPGPVFANVVIADEINRASPKTQSALLECMAEHQVTVDGGTYSLGDPFMVVATQNPVEMDGTYPLPEAQRDRFTVRISVGYPDPAAELAMLDEHGASDPMDRLRPVTDLRTVRAMMAATRNLHTAAEVRRYCVDIVGATRRLPEVRLGASPRATLHLLRAARAWAVTSGRGYVVPDDVQAVAGPVLAHRLVLSPEGVAARRSEADLVRTAVGRVAVPSPPRG
ncbi:AAA family ATPase [Pseudonocardia phyllosphaerae]|uniref:AAA family ATPase n=1 Tax=Pseudonocardia phyllosphaerae TaxID=3390502 RepID=UPI00397945F4